MASLLPTANVKYVADIIEGCVKNKFDVIIFVEGNRGLGKSSFLYKLGVKLNSRGIIKFNPNVDITYSREDTLKRLATKKFRYIMADELINVAYNRDFYEKDQKALLKALNMYRDSCNVFAGAVPKFAHLDTQIKQLCKIRITVVRRGLAVLQTQQKGIFKDDPWDTKINIKTEEKFLRNRNFRRSLSHNRITTARCYITFRDLTEPQRKLYEEIKHTKRGVVYAEYSDTGQEELDWYAQLYKLILEKRLSREALKISCIANNKNYEAIRNTLRQKLRADPEKRLNLAEYLKAAERKDRREFEKEFRKEIMSEAAKKTLEEKPVGINIPTKKQTSPMPVMARSPTTKKSRNITDNLWD